VLVFPAAEVITGPVEPATPKGDELPPEIVMKVNCCCTCSKSAANTLPLVASSLFASLAREAKSDQDQAIEIPGFRFWKAAKSSGEQQRIGNWQRFPASAGFQQRSLGDP
jgi:hypothetical protein